MTEFYDKPLVERLDGPFILPGSLARTLADAKAALLTRERKPGLPADRSATAIGYSADGRPWVLFNRENGAGFPPGNFWVACGFDADYPGGSPKAIGLFDATTDFIVEHEIVEVKA